MRDEINTRLIAELGLNYAGDFNRALHLAGLALQNGADYLKLQYYRPQFLFHDVEYIKLFNLKPGFFDFIRSLQLSDNQFIELLHIFSDKHYKYGISFFSEQDIRHLDQLYTRKYSKSFFKDLSFLKIASGEITDIPLLMEYLKISSEYSLKILISTGLASDGEINDCLHILSPVRDNITLLHCKVEYPAQLANFNLNRMNHLRKTFNLPSGLSDHSIGTELPLLSLAFNPQFIEKHFTDSRENKTADNPISTEPDEFKIIKETIQNYSSIMGNGELDLSEKEKKEITYARKGMYCNKATDGPQILTPDNIITLRPNLSANDSANYNSVIGKKYPFPLRINDQVKKLD